MEIGDRGGDGGWLQPSQCWKNAQKLAIIGQKSILTSAKFSYTMEIASGSPPNLTIPYTHEISEWYKNLGDPFMQMTWGAQLNEFQYYPKSYY